MRRPFAVAASVALAAAVLTPPASAAGCVYVSGGWLCSGDLPPGTVEMLRVGGQDRYETAVLLSHAFGSGHDGTAVYLVAHDGVDALPLGGYDLNGPILYVNRGAGTIPGSVADEVDRLAPSAVYAIGGTNAVTDAQLAAAVAAGQ